MDKAKNLPKFPFHACKPQQRGRARRPALGDYFSRTVTQRSVERSQLHTVLVRKVGQIPIGALARTRRWDTVQDSCITSNERGLLVADEILQRFSRVSHRGVKLAGRSSGDPDKTKFGERA